MWFAMKKKEIEFKLMVYTYGIKFMDEKESIIKTAWNIYETMKNTPVNELREKFIYELATLAHEQAQKEKEQADE
jgi:hypothetical protein